MKNEKGTLSSKKFEEISREKTGHIILQLLPSTKGDNLATGLNAMFRALDVLLDGLRQTTMVSEKDGSALNDCLGLFETAMQKAMFRQGEIDRAAREEKAAAAN